MRHIDPWGTLVVPGVLLAMGGPVMGWAKPVPVATSGLEHPRRAMVCVALAGPMANLAMALLWCGLLAGALRWRGDEMPFRWIELMCQAGIVVNVVLALFNLLPVPPLDGGRVLAGLLPLRWSVRLGRVEPFGMFLVLGFSVLRWLDWIFEPAFRMMGRVITSLLGSSA